MPSLLFIFTSADKDLKGGDIGWYLPEAAHPYYVLKDFATIDFASPKGPNPPVDSGGVKLFAEDPLSVQFLNDETVKSKLENAKKLSDVRTEDYDGVFYVGGLGPVIDLATDPINIKLASEFYQAGKITSAVCHGPAALVNAVDKDGKSIFSGKKATAFSNAEELPHGTEVIPFMTEDKISVVGTYEKSSKPWEAHVVIDGNLITGQNPASSTGVGKAILEVLQRK
ncbi:class I glutamine amidotransferase-like protein [Dendrothele bispora CBS 962.96]|uniref:D-lactate dehydratase n=1 Tax=Dendrothele bispora (strain CBS 962.96) TaxID=1314807 RepID=A0A4V4HHR8_DENBC|nr:class I glutamine amidotransferase-like protein [Dendrothele bispora CBS 962.96]